jgi:aspartyl-tRNA(Asn)/glutamyl-tRNA(Gln) amidotransferase subunit B
MSNNYETVIGLETHVQLSTKSKAFCGDAALFGGLPNTHVSAISLAQPGTLPRLNKEAVVFAVKLGLALGCNINPRSTFDRKNYFYADLPKGFQTTQDKSPICLGGKILVHPGKDVPEREIRIHHVHLEEDAGKSIHDQDPSDSLLDFNRAGVPLLEIVSEPDFRNADEVAAYMEEIRRLVRWLGISDGNMEEGSLRCDVNISVRKKGETRLGNRCEIKNMNSMRFAKRAIEYEVARQVEMLESGGMVEQQTRGFDVSSGQTFGLREKEDAHDYRYFPEPDLPPVRITTQQLTEIQEALDPLPWILEQAWQTKYGLPAYDAALLSQERDIALYFEKILSEKETALPAKSISNLLINKLLPWSSESGAPLAECPVTPGQWCSFLQLIEQKTLSASTAYQRLFPALMDQASADPAALAASMNLLQDADADWLGQLADDVLARMPDKVAEYRKGKKGLLGLFMGELMKASKGKADPSAATAILTEKLKG